ncbi:hypothetical protein [Fulvivirga ligni]|uniref:hypothetical protein n=1 Tax=Fulvivirga ligni TaxID=2904246 RepID=UPI001F1F63C6|nr:hypothetical protein [Fulvivirga ligni]UII23148.1 hypothetical protein LVD16_07905 [Fulvivirga ligni]
MFCVPRAALGGGDHAAGVKRIKVPFAAASIHVPASYNVTTINAYQELLNNVESPNELAKGASQALEQLKSSNYKTAMLVDSTDARKVIFFQQGDYIPMTASLAAEYLILLSQTVKKNWALQNIKCTRIKDKYISWKDAKIVKIKYKLEVESYNMYTTHYLITANNRTWALNINSPDEEDFEDLLTSIKLY